MKTLLDYCQRGKVEHLIRMRERLDCHSRYLESQIAGLEALVKERGETDIVVPPLPDRPDQSKQRFTASATVSEAGAAPSERDRAGSVVDAVKTPAPGPKASLSTATQSGAKTENAASGASAAATQISKPATSAPPTTTKVPQQPATAGVVSKPPVPKTKEGA